MKTNITDHSSSELSLNFNNVESLYNEYMRAVRLNNFKIVKDIAEELFEFTEEQIDELEDDFNSEVEEYNKQ